MYENMLGKPVMVFLKSADLAFKGKILKVQKDWILFERKEASVHSKNPLTGRFFFHVSNIDYVVELSEKE